jgi:error-prone DNA polymerase
MPDPPVAKRRPLSLAGGKLSAATCAYAELHAKSNFSFLEGASHPDELVQQAALLGYRALAITDRNSLAGVVRAHVAAKEIGLPLLIGAEITPGDAPPVVLWATDRASYGRLARLITCGRRRAAKGHCQLWLDDIASHAQGLLAGVRMDGGLPIAHCGFGEGEAPAEPTHTRNVLSRYREIFGDRCYLLAELHLNCDDARRKARLGALSRASGLPLVAAGDVYYHVRQRQALQDVLTAIRHGVTVAQAGALLFANADRHLHPPEEIAARFADLPGAVERTLEIAGRCRFSLDELRYEYPEELCPPGEKPIEYLRRLTFAGAARRYRHVVPDKVRRLIEHELALIEELRYEAYFLTVWDLVRFARSRGILCQGRGSAANSAVCYCLGVTSVDPSRMDVLFERFVSRERNEAPDIDVDFEHQRREEVLQYIYQKYGRDRAGMTAEVITYRPRSAIRDVGKALGLSLDRVDALAKVMDEFGPAPQIARHVGEAGLDAQSPLVGRLIQLVRELLGFPRHLSQHVGGMVITQGPLCELVPLENAAMEGRTVIEWDKDDLDNLGILKVDCLALGMLTAIHRALDLIAKHKGRQLTLASVPPEDPAVYEMVSRADTMGVFQIESRAQMSMLPRLKPRCFYDLVIEVAIVRPGPIQGNMVHPYLRRRAGLEPIEYPNDAIGQVLEKTLGVPIFQEQAMRLAVVAAGFTPGEADQLRRAMGAWRRPGLIEQFHERLIHGMRQRGLSAEFAQRVFEQLRGFGEYGFPESHAASFALLVYVSAWIKHYHPDVFAAALLNSQPMGFYAPPQLVRDAQAHGVEVRPVDVNFSHWDCTLERQGETPTEPHEPRFAVRLGLRQIHGLPEKAARLLEQARRGGRFRSLDDLVRRTGISQAILIRLAKADALRSLKLDRRQALWESLAQEKEMPLFARCQRQVDLPALPPLGLAAQVRADYDSAGLSLRCHPLAFLRAELDRLRVLRASQLRDWPANRFVRVAGLVLLRQRPGTASGITFVTLEDETGYANLIVHPKVWARYHRTASTARAIIASGALERQGQIIHVIVSRMEDLTVRLGRLRSASRDFR